MPAATRLTTRRRGQSRAAEAAEPTGDTQENNSTHQDSDDPQASGEEEDLPTTPGQTNTQNLAEEAELAGHARVDRQVPSGQHTQTPSLAGRLSPTSELQEETPEPPGRNRSFTIRIKPPQRGGRGRASSVTEEEAGETHIGARTSEDPPSPSRHVPQDQQSLSLTRADLEAILSSFQTIILAKCMEMQRPTGKS